MDKPSVDDKWIGNNQEVFLVTRIVYADKNAWIHYEKLSDGTQYSCLEESFVFRFTKLYNENK